VAASTQRPIEHITPVDFAPPLNSRVLELRNDTRLRSQRQHGLIAHGCHVASYVSVRVDFLVDRDFRVAVLILESVVVISGLRATISQIDNRPNQFFDRHRQKDNEPSDPLPGGN